MVVRTYAPRGQTPVLHAPLSWEHLSVMGALTTHGHLYTLIQDRSVNGQDVVRFLRYLLRCLPGKLLVVWDGLPAHRGQAVKDFLTQGGAGRIELKRLPAYAPELNPTEGIWSYLKRVELKNRCCPDLSTLRSELRQAIKRLRQKPDVLAGCVKQPGIYV
jgi:transposase